MIMTTAQELENRFRSRGVLRGGVLLLPASEALSLVEAAREGAVVVLGVDGFYLGDGATQPALEHSIDLSVVSAANDSWSTALEFIRSRPPGLHFEVVLG